MNKKLEFGTLDKVFDQITSIDERKTAILFEDEKISHKEMRKIVYNMAFKLRQLGIEKDDKVAIIFPNCYEYLTLYFSVFLLGAWVVPINSRTKPKELKNILKDAQPKIIFYQKIIDNRDYELILDDLSNEISSFVDYQIIRGGEKAEGNENLLSFEKFFEIDNNIDEIVNDFKSPELVEDDVALLAYTSGTTSAPKGVMITHKGLVYTSYYTGELWGLFDNPEHNYTGFSVAPLYAAQGFLAVLIDMVCGVTMKWVSTFNPNAILKTMSNGEANVFHTQPTMWSLLLSSPLVKFANFSDLKFSVVSGSLCSSNLARRIEETTKCDLLNAYGLIEATGVVTITRPGDSYDVRMNTVGRPIPGVEIKIVDENRNELPKGEIGEVAIKGYLMKGYYNNPAKTENVIDEEGWLYSGDSGCVYDEDGNIQVVGRTREMIIRGGFNVFPIDIEEELLNHPMVLDAAVVGKKNEILGEAIVAFVVPRPGEIPNKGILMEHFKKNISDYKIPDEIYFVKQLPTILSGKVLKNKLEEWVNNECIPEEELIS